MGKPRICIRLRRKEHALWKRHERLAKTYNRAPTEMGLERALQAYEKANTASRLLLKHGCLRKGN
jgi:aspartate aminotransferase-like enzyme